MVSLCSAELEKVRLQSLKRVSPGLSPAAMFEHLISTLGVWGGRGENPGNCPTLAGKWQETK
eukprot:1152163-Pelagomonas_calceolata.AAC.1